MKSTLLLAALVTVSTALSQPLNGLWDATITVNGLAIPFRIELSHQGSNAQGSFFNGDEKITSTSGRFERGALVLAFAYYGSKLEASWKDGSLAGAYFRMGQSYPFRAKPFVPTNGTPDNVPAVAGVWEIESQNEEGSWRFVVRQSGAEVSAAVLRVDGDTGTLSGSYRGGKFILSHFSGARPSLFEITPRQDGSLGVFLNGAKQLTAFRPTDARAKGLPEPADPSRYTSVKDPSQKFHFSFPDLDGRLVSDTDPRFRGKVVIVTIGGSWCPNCHDEAPFLEELYRKYRARGLEIVALSFEEADVLKDPARVRAFIQRYGIEYPVLLAGETSELSAKLPQAVNLHAYPTTFFLSRDGRVRGVHAGFTSIAMGDLHRQLIEETTSLVERLLMEQAPR